MPPSPPLPSKRHSSSNSSRYEERKEPIRSSRIQPSTDYMNQAPPPPNITSSRHRYEHHSSESRRMRSSHPSPPPPPPPASRPKDSTVNIWYGAQLATDHHYRSRDDRSDRRDESRRKDSSGGSSSRHAHVPYDSNKSSYGMSRNSESNSWSSAAVKNSYGTVGSSSGTNTMEMSSRPDPWSHNTFRDVESSIWQRPSQPLPEKWNSTPSNPSSMPISGRSSSSNALYSNNHQVIPNIGLNMSTNYSDSRFDSYKMSGMSRKY
ncbi:uncharacterized protein LOC100575122 [Acyrthosiphon pisum]|nr:uncharacterized protein LOC100575122 [Acyrthosiphon pisum]|eukprot:XP_003248894.3 PREDICTED: uncharacterized protein LOC100575122 [Acyrthosiphon pisum]